MATKVATSVKVKMLMSVAGMPMPHYGLNREFSFLFGQEHSIPEELANSWVACGHCEIVKDAAK